MRQFLMLGIGLGLLTRACLTTACTTIIVGSSATTDGSTIIARNNDTERADQPEVMFYQPPRNTTFTFHSNSLYNPFNNTFSWTLPANTYGYLGMPDWHSIRLRNPSFHETAINSNGVAMSATESIYNSPAVLRLDPYLRQTGITEESIIPSVLPTLTSALQGVKLLGEIIEAEGAGEGFGVAFIDKDGAWYLETVCGHHWVARSIPGQSYFVSANQGRIQEMDFSDPDHYQWSTGLPQFAEKNGLYDPAKAPLNIFKCCMTNDKHDTTYNYPRVRELITMYSGSEHDNNDGLFTLFPTPSRQLSILDVARGLRNHFDGTAHDAYLHRNPKEPWRPVSVFRAAISHITQLRSQSPWPAEIANIQYIALGMTALSAYVPFYQGLEKVPAAYQGATNEADDNSLFWMYRKLQALVMKNYTLLAPPVQIAIADFEADNVVYQIQLEEEYLKLWTHDLPAAKQLIQTFTENTVIRHKEMLQTQIRNTLATLNWQPLSNRDYTTLVNEIEALYHFGGL